MILRKAKTKELHICYQCIEDARTYHKSLGFEQWHPDYPTLKTIEEDIQKGIGFAFADGDTLLGYCCIIIGDEPSYAVIDGSWKTEQPYAVVHRMAFLELCCGKKYSVEVWDLIKTYCEKKTFLPSEWTPKKKIK